MATLGRNDLKNRTFSIFQTESSQGFPVNLPWLKYISMAKMSDENAGQKRQCKPTFEGQDFWLSINLFLDEFALLPS